MLWRHGSGKIGLRCAWHVLNVHQTPCNHVLRKRRCNPHRYVYAFLRQIDLAIQEHQLQLQLRITLQQLWQQGREAIAGEGQGSGDSQTPTHLSLEIRQFSLRFPAQGYGTGCGLVKNLPRFGEAETARRAMQ